jgi:putative oxidoreductase
MRIDVGLLILRVCFSLMMLTHGWPKLANFSHMMNNFPNPFGLGSTASLILVVFAEFFCAIAVMIGLFTRYAVIPLVITMLVAAFIIHVNDPWAKMEFALMYAVAFSCLFFTGAGNYSLDRFLKKQ